MLSIEKCRELIGENDFTDEEIRKIRDDLYELGEIALEDYVKTKISRES